MQRFHIHRFEFKYLLTLKQYLAIKEELLNYADYDEYCLVNPDKSYTVYSLYYDSPARDNFWEKIDGLGNRKKFRFRVYDISPENEPDVYLEIKRKRNSVILKDRARLKFGAYTSAYENGHTSLLDDSELPLDQKKVVEELVYNVLRFNLRPAVLVAYKREAFFGKYHSNIRVTFDSEIKSYKTDSLFSLSLSQPDTILSKEIILELKFNGSLPHWFHYIIQKYDLTRDTHSKYCSSLIESFNIAI